MYWNPSPNVFSLHIPFAGRPVVWYGVLFALGIFLTYRHFLERMTRKIRLSGSFGSIAMQNEEKFITFLQSDLEGFTRVIRDRIVHYLGSNINPNLDAIRVALNQTLNDIPFFEKYGVLTSYDRRRTLEIFLSDFVKSGRVIATQFCEKMLFYSVIGLVAGARLGNILFYQDAGFYLSHPAEIFKVWNGGLASHGGVIGVLIGVALFWRTKGRKMVPFKSFLSLADAFSYSSLLAAVCIRLGNLMNQEILGHKTNLPWGIFFGRPLDGSLPGVRHPVQLYEAVGYASLFILFSRFIAKREHFMREGRMFGLFLTLLFSFRFSMEFFKERMSLLLQNESLFSMGQYLSIPFILLGLFLLFIYNPGKVSKVRTA